MNLHRILLILVVVLSAIRLSAQNISLPTLPMTFAYAPQSGCALTGSEIVKVTVSNLSNTIFIPANTITMNYRVDGGSVVSQLLSANIAPGGVWNFTFGLNANLSACGSHTVKVWANYPPDVDHTNDTLQWVVQNDCNIIPGTVTSNTTVCASGNTGTMNIAGWMYGTIADWEYSTNGGGSWISLGQNGATYTFNNLTTQTMYRVRYDGGYCPDATSGSATVSLEAPVMSGNILGDGTFCETGATGILQLVGTPDPVIQWQYSNVPGVWNTIANATSTQTFTGLTTSTKYRAFLEGGSCPDSYSDTAFVNVDHLQTPGDILGSTSHCASTANGALTVTGSNMGNVNYWQYSVTGGAPWTTVPLANPTYNYSGLFTTTWYRALTEGGACPDIYTDTALIIVQPVPPQPTLNGATALCANNVNGNLTLTGPFSTILQWESSTDGVTWNPIANTNPTQSYTGINITTKYRVKVEGNLCPDLYSNEATIYIDPVVSPGLMLGGDSLCVTSVAGTVNLLGSIGSISYWEQSTDQGNSWSTIVNNSDVWDYTGITQTTWYRAFLDGGLCPDGYSDTGIVYVDSLVIPGHVAGTDSLCEMAIFGFLNLGGSNGTVSHWESSVDGVNWDVILNSTPNLNYFSVDTTTYYRVYSKALFCTGAYSDTAVIYIDPLTVPGEIDSSMWVCAGSSANLSLNNYTASIFQWQSSADGINWNDVAGANQNTYNPVDVTANQYYHVITQNGLCPPETTDPILISVFTPPFVDAGNDTTILLYDEIPLSGIGGVSGVWSPTAGLSNPNAPFTLAKPNETTTYYFTVTDAQGCKAVDSVLITINRPDHVEIMNVITANSDSYNDCWIIDGVEYFPSTFVAVYNIYGKQVYASTDYRNDWKGTFNEKPLPNGTYYYAVIPGGTNDKIQGTLMIMGKE